MRVDVVLKKRLLPGASGAFSFWDRSARALVGGLVRVRVAGGADEWGVVVATSGSSSENNGKNTGDWHEVLEVAPCPLLPPESVEIAQQIAQEERCSLAACVRAMVPRGTWDGSVWPPARVVYSAATDADQKLPPRSPALSRLLDMLQQSKKTGALPDKTELKNAGCSSTVLARAVALGLAIPQEIPSFCCEMTKLGGGGASPPLRFGGPLPHSLLRSHGSKFHVRSADTRSPSSLLGEEGALRLRFASADSSTTLLLSCTAKQVCHSFADTRSPSSLFSGGGGASPPLCSSSPPPEPTFLQQEGRHIRVQQLAQLAAEWLGQGSSALLLAPEAAGAQRLFDSLLAAGLPSSSVAMLTGETTASKRSELFFRVREAATPLVVMGTRPAALLPWRRGDLGFVAVEEANLDLGHLSQRSPRIHSAGLAAVVARSLGAQLVLAAAVPRLSAAHQGIVRAFPAIAAPPPKGKVRVISAGEELPNVLASQILELQKSATSSQKTRVVVIINRRGSGRVVRCLACAALLRSPASGAPLLPVRGPKSAELFLRCTATGRVFRLPERCPSCGAAGHLAARGLGVGFVHEELARRLSGLRIVRLDADTLATAPQARSLFAAVQAGDFDVAIGTQGLLGAELPIGCAGIICPDADLLRPDFRADYQALSLLFRLRDSLPKAKQLLLLTREQANLPLFKAFESGDHSPAIAAILADRKAHHLPPFGDFARIHVFGKSPAAALARAQQVAELANQAAKRLQAEAFAAYPNLSATRPRRGAAFCAGVSVLGKGIREVLDAVPLLGREQAQMWPDRFLG